MVNLDLYNCTGRMRLAPRDTVRQTDRLNHMESDMTDILEHGHLTGKDMNGVLWAALNDLVRANAVFADVIADLMPSQKLCGEGDETCDLLEPTTRDIAEDVAVFASRLRYQAERMADLVKSKDAMCDDSPIDCVAPPPAKVCDTKKPVNLPSPTGRVRR